jgi:hypothetical protein
MRSRFLVRDQRGPPGGLRHGTLCPGVPEPSPTAALRRRLKFTPAHYRSPATRACERAGRKSRAPARGGDSPCGPRPAPCAMRTNESADRQASAEGGATPPNLLRRRARALSQRRPPHTPGSPRPLPPFERGSAGSAAHRSTGDHTPTVAHLLYEPPSAVRADGHHVGAGLVGEAIGLE